MLAAKTISKVQLYDGNSNKWKKALLRLIPKDQLPARYGGDLPDILKKVKYSLTLANDRVAFCQKVELTHRYSAHVRCESLGKLILTRFS